ncbi:MAG: hypothetical protein Q8Q31_00595 [Nanoarchaeota archaeon]|nr:hypothetical protein [Nanoarchaeota archaeon]
MKEEIGQPSNGLVKFLSQSAGAKVIVEKEDRRLNYSALKVTLGNASLSSLSELLDKFYSENGFNVAPLSSARLPRFILRTYRHVAGGSSQVMVSQERNSFYFFVEDNENLKQAELRYLIQKK